MASGLDTRQPAFASAPLDDAAQALFEEARERARRRRRRRAVALVGVVLFIAAGVAVGLESGGGGGPTGSHRRLPLTVPSQQVLARSPYMGVSCRRPNSIACDRVGLAVWTRRPARAVQATVAGRTFALDNPEWSVPRTHMFAGFLHNAGLRGNGALAVEVENGHNRWTAVRPVSARVHLIITYRDGSQRATTVRVLLAPGWG